MENHHHSLVNEGIMAASPIANAVESLINDSITSMNDTFFLPRITQNDSFESPSPQSPVSYNIADIGMNVETATYQQVVNTKLHSDLVKLVYDQVLRDITATFNTKAIEFFQQFESRLEGIVVMKLKDMLSKKPSLLDFEVDNSQPSHTLKTAEERIHNLNPKLDKLETVMEDGGVFDNICSMHDKLQKQLQEASDLIMANNIAEKDMAPSPIPSLMQDQIDSLVTEQLRLRLLLDEQQQYSRREILEFRNMLFRCHPDDEDTAQEILDFVLTFFGLRLSRNDISICHRVVIPDEKRKMGRDYVPLIYCKFVRREVAHAILKRRHMLRNVLNARGKQYVVNENLTLCRRQLKERVEKELTSYRFYWVRNGNIYVKKHPRSRPIQISNEATFEKLLAEQKAVSKNIQERVSSVIASSSFPSKHPLIPLSHRGL